MVRSDLVVLPEPNIDSDLDAFSINPKSKMNLYETQLKIRINQNFYYASFKKGDLKVFVGLIFLALMK